MNSDSAIQLVQIGCGATVILSSLEILSVRREFRDEGWFSWQICRNISPPTRVAVIDRCAEVAFRYPQVLYLVGIRLVSGIALVALPFGPAASTMAAALACLTTFALAYRCPFGQEGSDQLALVLSGSLLLAALGRHTVPIALTFISLQLCLAYVTAGGAKLISRSWRDGSAIRAVFETKIYGHPYISRLFRFRYTALIAGWAVILWELTFPLSFLFNHQVVISYLVVGVIFHGSTAIFMGLNNFVVVFVSAYPALIWASEKLGN